MLKHDFCREDLDHLTVGGEGRLAKLLVLGPEDKGPLFLGFHLPLILKEERSISKTAA